jgi:uncharacterized membrane protein YqhA
MAQRSPHTPATEDGRQPSANASPPSPFARTIGYTRYVVLLAVAAVLLVAMALFVLGTGLAVVSVVSAFQAVLQGDLGSTDLTVKFLEIVSVMLKAVVFYIVGIGLYSLFIAPLNLTVALGMETLGDVESKVVSVITLIMAITFLEHFIQWQQPTEILLYGVTLAVVVAVLVLFQFHSQHVKEAHQRDDGQAQGRAQQRLFHQDQVEQADCDIPRDGRVGPTPQDDRPAP